MRSVALQICFLCLGVGWASVFVSAQDGAALFGKYCAACHESGGEGRAPGRPVLRQMSPEQIVVALETGIMLRQGLERTPAERRAIAAFLSGKPFGSEPLNALPKSAFCDRASQPQDPLSGAAWNGWGVTTSNSRFQSANAAGMTAEDVPRLKLK